jgi:acyl-coenzyme A synthetase/AMP-(fatty) acid ligase
MPDRSMSHPFLALETLLKKERPGDFAVALDGDRILRWKEFSALVQTYRRPVPGAPLRILVSGQSALHFLAQLLAVLADGDTAVLPPNFQPDTLSALSSEPMATSPASIPHAALEFYTSGSSGKPKRILKTLAQLDAECRVQENCWGARIGDAMVAATAPYHHIYGLIFRLLWPLCAGRKFDNLTLTDPPMLFERLNSLGNAILVSSPAYLSRLPEHVNEVSAAPKLVFCSGGPLRGEVAAQVHRLWGAAPIEIYGSTESGGIAWRRQDEDLRWSPLPGVIVDSASDGALLVNSPFIDGLDPLRMEDCADLQEDGRFILHGRLDRIVKIEEKRLSLPEMETWLAEHDGVAECAIAPLPIEGRTFVGAVVVAHAGCANDRKAFVSALGEHLRRKFDPVLIPRRWRFVDRLPYNERGKLAVESLVNVLVLPS